MHKPVYETVKNIIPRPFLKANEAFFRRIIYGFYKGIKHQCPVCGKKLRKFISLKNGDKLCPFCGSLPRHRRLWTLIKPFLLPGVQVLDFSPPLYFYKRLKSFDGIKYIATDYEGEFTSDYHFDITKVDLPANTVDLILCYHILEHVEDDEKAIGELYKILKPKGQCFIQTPFKDGNTYEDFAKQTKQERKEHFGQEDHVRIYSVQGLKERLEKQGFKVEVLTFSEEETNYFGLSTTEYVFQVSK